MLRATGLFWAAILFTTVAMAQEVKVEVRDNMSPVSLLYVNVYNGDSLKATTQTDDNGRASVSPEKYPCSIEIVGAGYERIIRLLSAAPANNELKFSVKRKTGQLEEVVVTGVTQPVKLKDAFSVYQVIPRAMIQAQGAVTLDEALKNQLNVRVGNDNILGSNVSLQGLSGDKVKILIDGMPVNGREGGNINIGQLNMNNVERIEMIQGPMSVVYGSDALGGVINIITRKENKNLGLNVNTYYESVGKYNADATAILRLNERQTLTLGGGRNYFQGWKYTDVPLTYQDDTLEYNRTLLFKPKEQFIGNLAYAYNAASGFNMTLASDFLKETVANKGQIQIWDPFLGCYAFDEYYKTTRSINRLTMNGKAGKTGNWQTQFSYNLYIRERERLRKNMVTLNEIPTQGQGDQDTSRFDDVSLRSGYTNKIKNITYTAGYDVNIEYARSNKIAGRNADIQDYALYANASLPLLKDKLTAQIGARGAVNSVYKPPVMPSINFLYKPVEKVQVRASYSKGFRAPSLKEMYLSFIDLNHYIIGSTDLKAEQSHHVQASASYQVYQKKSDYLQFILTGFYNNVYDGIALGQYVNDSSKYTYRNIDHQSNTIATMQADGQWSNLHFQLGYSYNHTFLDTSSFGASEATASVQYAFKKLGANANLFYKLSGKQRYLQVGIDGNASFGGQQDAYQILDGSIEKKLWDNKIQFIVGVKNIFNVTQIRNTGGAGTGGVHGTGSTSSGLLPRSIFTNLRLSLGN